MTMPVRSLTVLQNWDCRSCGSCCYAYRVYVTDEERARIESQGWEKEPEFQGVPIFLASRHPLKGHSHYLGKRADDGCIFLDENNRCKIHAKFGAAAKPFACRAYPFVFVPAGDHWRVGLRFSCPSAAANLGREVVKHVSEIREYLPDVEADNPRAVDCPPTPLRPRQTVPWGDVVRFANAISLTLGDVDDTLERRWRRVLKFADMCRMATFDGGGDAKKAVTGGRLNEFLYVIRQAMADDTLAAEKVPPPGWAGRSVFRPLAALFWRKDSGPDKGTVQASALGRLRAGLRFALGTGRVPQLNARMPSTTFAATETPTGGLSADAQAMLTRYYRTKVESLQFCGPTNFDLPFWDGLESLALTFPVICWLARVLVSDGRPHDEAVKQSLEIVDDNFAYNPLLGKQRQKFALRLLGLRGELPKLIAWYAR